MGIRMLAYKSFYIPFYQSHLLPRSSLVYSPLTGKGRRAGILPNEIKAVKASKYSKKSLLYKAIADEDVSLVTKKLKGDDPEVALDRWREPDLY